VGVVSRPKSGEPQCGDAVGFWQERSWTLVAVVDGLGSGLLAAQASQKALACVADHRREPLLEIVDRCHQALQDTRGAVLALTRVYHREQRLRYVGVGNIGLSAASMDTMQPVSQNGLVGQRLPRLVECEYRCSPGDLIALYTDGISGQFRRQGGLPTLSSSHWTDPQRLAQQLMDAFGTADDDTSVAVLMVTVPPIVHKWS